MVIIISHLCLLLMPLCPVMAVQRGSIAAGHIADRTMVGLVGNSFLLADLGCWGLLDIVGSAPGNVFRSWVCS